MIPVGKQSGEQAIYLVDKDVNGKINYGAKLSVVNNAFL